MRVLLNLCSIVLLALSCGGSLWAVSCPVATPHSLSEAEQAYLRSEYDRASALYSQALQANPFDPQLTAGLVDVLLKQQRVEEAENILQKAITVHPKSVALQTSLGLVQYREGALQLAANSAAAAMGIDPCYPRIRLLNVLLLRLNSMFKSAADELRTAHLLDPYDPEIRRRWITTLPLQQRITEEEAYLASANGNDPDDLRRMRLYLEALKTYAAQPHKSCQLVSTEVSTEIPFARIMRDATHIQAFGLDVKLNGHGARLEIDTGASGLLISRSVANKIGLEPVAQTELGGVGSGPERSGYTAYVDTIKIGTLEFHDCEVEVIQTNNVVGIDGLVGMDVFSRMMVTLDYPMRKLDLGPLPARPQEASIARPALDTNDVEDVSAKTGANTKAVPGPHDRYVAPEMKDWTRVYRVGHQLIIPAELNQSKPKLFILDTGAFTTSISPEAAREVTKVHSDDHLRIRGINGKVEKVYEADDVTFTFANIRQPGREVVAFDTSNISKHNGIEISGFIGFTTLGQLTVKIDYRDALVKFEYNPNRGYH